MNNLEWCTNKENRIHALRNGLATVLRGSCHYNTKMTELDAVRVIEYLSNGMRNIDIAQQLSISVATVEGIKYGKTWKHLAR